MVELENHSDSNEEKLDIKSLIKKLFSYWYYFILSTAICSFVALGYNRYTRPVYSVSGTILIEDEKNQPDQVIEIVDIISGDANLENQKQILKTYHLAEITIKKLNLGVSYFKHGLIQTVNQYKHSPFNIKFDSTHLQLAGVEFFLTPIKNNQFSLSFECEDQNTYNLQTDLKNNKLQASLKRKEIYNFGDTIETDYYSFTIKKSEFFTDKSIEEETEYSFILHSLNNLASKYTKSLKIETAAKDGTVLRLTMEGHTHKKIVDYLNTLAGLYILQGLDHKNMTATNTLYFISNQIQETKDTLHLIENKLKEFKEKNPTLDVYDKDYGTFFQKQKTEGNVSEYQVHLSYYKELLSYLQNSYATGGIVSPTSVGISNSELNSLISQFITLSSEKNDLEVSQKVTKAHPKYQAVLSKISFTKQSIIENLKNLIASTNSAKRELEKRINDFEKEIDQLPESEKEYVQLKREFMQAERIVNYLILKKQEIQVAREGVIADHIILDQAGIDNISTIPISPKEKLNFFFALIIGIGLPIIIISLRNFLNETILSKSDLSKITNIPIIGVIGNSDTANNLMVLDNPKSLISESFRSLRTNIQYLASDTKNKVITITSSVGSEGKTFCSSNLALIMATAGYKTILIGSDLRKPKIHEDFNINNSSGLSLYLINKSRLSDIVHKTDTENLSVISSGPIPPNPSELLNSERMKKLISELKKTYDYIIMDTPPAGLVTDSVITMKLSDINLYVVRHKYTKKNMLNIINDLHDSEQVKNINIIINDYIVSSSSYGYGYGYGYGSGYGYYE